MSGVLELLLHMNVGACEPKWMSLLSEMNEARPLPIPFVSVYPKFFDVH